MSRRAGVALLLVAAMVSLIGVRAEASSCVSVEWLVAYWQLNGNSVDRIADNDLVSTGLVDYPTGRLGSAARIDGSEFSYLSAPSLASYSIGSSGFTLEFWVNAATLPGVNPRLVAATTNSSGSWQVNLCKYNCSIGRVSFLIGSTELVSSSGIADASWHHVATTYDGTWLRIYIDGVQDAALNAPGLEADVDGGILAIGQNIGNLQDQFDGMIDEVRIWAVARSGMQIQQAYEQEILFLAGYWPLNGLGTDLFAGNTLTPVDAGYGPGRLRAAALIPGGAYFSAPANASYNVTPQGFTVEFWMNSATLPGSNPRMVVAASADYSQTWQVNLCRDNCPAGAVSFYVGGYELLSSTLVNDGGWHHVAGTYDGTDLELYIDGTLEATTNQPGLAVDVSDGALVLGRELPSDIDRFDGKIDDLRIWRVARTAEEIQESNAELCPGPVDVPDRRSPAESSWAGAAVPNPFHSATRLAFRVDRATRTEVAVFDASGARVRRVRSFVAEPGTHIASWDGTNDAGARCRPGIYWLRVARADEMASRSIILLR